MHLPTWQDRVAGAAMHSRRSEGKGFGFERVFRVMDHVGQARARAASKMAAAFELRKEYAPVIIRLRGKAEMDGHSAQMPKDERRHAAEALEKWT